MVVVFIFKLQRKVADDPEEAREVLLNFLRVALSNSVVFNPELLREIDD